MGGARRTAAQVRRLAPPLTLDPSPLVAALEEGPQTFIHGNWELAKLGRHPDGHTVLFDLLGAVVQFGWEKALGGEGPELDWWIERAEEGRARLS